MLTQCQRQNTSPMTLGKQLLLPINQGSVPRPFPNYLGVHNSTVRKVIRKWTQMENIQQNVSILSILPWVDVPASTLQGQTAMLRETAKDLHLKLNKVQMLHVKIHHSASIKRLNKYCSFGRIATKHSSFWKERGIMALGLLNVQNSPAHITYFYS